MPQFPTLERGRFRPTSAPCRRRLSARGAALALAVVAAAACARGEDPAPPAEAAPREVAAVLVPVRLPIAGTRDTQVEGSVVRVLDKLVARPGERGVLVLRFDGADEAGAASSTFGRALELARFLGDARLAGVKTVAWLPEGARGHAVLVALACEEIVMAPDAVIAAGTGAEIDDATRAAYVQVAGRRRTAPPALALGLVDPTARPVRVATDDGEQVVAEQDLPGLRAKAAVLHEEALAPVPLELTGRRARELGLVRLLARSAAEVARGLGVPEGALADNPALDGGWRATQVVISGAIGAEAVARTKKRISEAVERGKNMVCLRIDSAGGDPDQALVLAGFLAGLDPARVRTVAWVPDEARGDAALVAAACDEVVMAPGALLGGEGGGTIEGRQADAVAVAWREAVARKRARSWSLPVALAVPGIVVRQATRAGTGQVAYFSDEELAQRDDRDAWKVGAEVGRGPITLNGRGAEALQLATHVVDDFAGLARAYGIEEEVETAESGWADTLLDALASPAVAWILLLVGAAGLYLELHTPGIGLGGFVAMVAFIVYFWSQHLHGTSGWLEVMLFLAGLFCVAAEIFVVPGVGILGLGGGLLMVAALVLASQSFILPTNAYQLRQLQNSLLGILGAAAGVTALAVVARRWLPESRLFRHVLLQPPSADEPDDVDPLAALVGLEGETTTRLAPAGKARVGGALHDVASDGRLLEPGTRVRVVAVRGGLLLVRAADDGRELGNG